MYKYIQMKKGLTKEELLEILGEWNQFLRRRVHMIACGGTAMTLLGVKESTKVDYEDCLALAEARIGEINIDKLVEHFNEMITHDISHGRLKPNIEYFIDQLREKGLHD